MNSTIYNYLDIILESSRVPPEPFDRLVVVTHPYDLKTYWKQRRLCSKDLVVSTFFGLPDLLADASIRSFELGSLTEPDDIIPTYLKGKVAVGKISKLFDEKIARPALQQSGWPPFDLFSSIFSFNGSWYYLNLSLFVSALDRLFDYHRPKEVAFYSSQCDVSAPFSKLGFLMLTRAVAARRRVSFRFFSSLPPKSVALPFRMFSLMKSFFGDPKFALQKVLFHLSLQRSPSGNKAALLLLGSPHLLGDAILSPSHWDLLLIDSSTGRGINFKPKQKVSVDRLLRSFKNTMSSFHFSPQYLHAPEMVSDVIADTFYRYFRCSLTALLSTLDYSRIYGEESNPSGIIWEFPPVCHPHGAVFLAGLRALWPEIPVWGCQGGGIDGLQDQKGRLEEVQFRYCNRFFSFGHNLEDLIELGYDPASLPTIIPSGWPKISPSLKRIKRNRRPVDLLFPLTNIPHYAIVNHPSVTFINQIKILSLLENFVDKTIVAKPYPFAKDHTACSVINLLRKLKHVRTCWDMSLCQWLRQYHPQAIVLEISSTPLLEVLSEDAEILLLHDPVIPYTKHALSLLTRRVHYCYTLEELLDTLHKWRAGELPRKRDDSFFKKYVFRPDSKEIIQQDIASHLLKTHVRSTPPRKNGHLRRKNG